MKNLIKKYRIRILSTLLWGAVMIATLIVFYIFKAHNEFFISFNSKLLIMGCIAGSSLLVLFRPRLYAWLSYILELITVILASVFLFTYFEPLVNSMEMFNRSARGINILIVFAIIILAYGIFQNAGYGVAVGGGIVYVLYIVNYYTFGLRGTPFVLSDFFSAKTALGVMPNYHLVLNERILVCFYVLALLAAFGCFVSVRPKKAVQRIVSATLGIVTGAVLIVLITFTETITRNRFAAVEFIPAVSAQQNGFPLNTIIALKASFIKEPEGYSPEKVEEIIQANSNLAGASDSVPATKPNIIVIMNESLTDFDYLLNVQVTEEPMPKFKAMQENCVKGTLISSIYGGNTPNSEFEFLTGCSLAFLPQGIVTFNQLIDHELPTFVTHLKDLGYSATAIHVYNPEFFSRSRIYPLLGFDEFININNTTVPIDIIGDYATDETSFRAIEQAYENRGDNPFFTFCVTIQNHGGYWHWGRDILVTNANSDYANDYASLLRKTDNAFADLIDYFSNVSEPTIIVMFGDHQPNLFDDFYDAIWTGYDLTEKEMTYLKSKVPFIIWANYDIEEQKMGEMSINYLGPTILKTAGLPLTGFQTYLDKLREDVPVVSGIGYVDGNGEHFSNPASSAYEGALKDYEYLQFNYLKQNSDDEFYK